MWIWNNHKEINISDPIAAGHTLAETGNLKTVISLWNIYLPQVERMSKNILKHCACKRWASSVPMEVTSVMTNLLNLNKPLSILSMVISGFHNKNGQGPTAPRGDTKGMVTATFSCRRQRTTLLPEKLFQALPASKTLVSWMLFSNNVSEGGGTIKVHLLMSMLSKATTTRPGKGMD